MKVEPDRSIKPDEDVTIAIESSGIKVSDRGEWIRHKWRVRRSFIKIRLAADVKTKQTVSKEDAPNEKDAKPLVEEASSKAEAVKVIGAYDSKEKLRLLTERGIEPCIKVRKDSTKAKAACLENKP